MTTTAEVKDALSRLSRDERVVVLSMKERLEGALASYGASFELKAQGLTAAINNLNAEISAVKEQLSNWKIYMDIIHEKGELLNLVDIKASFDATFDEVAKGIGETVKSQRNEVFAALEKMVRRIEVVELNKFNNAVTLFMILKDVFKLQEDTTFEFRTFSIEQFESLGEGAGWLPYATSPDGMVLCFRIEKNGEIGTNSSYATMISEINNFRTGKK